jgi:hypothetical protein
VVAINRRDDHRAAISVGAITKRPNCIKPAYGPQQTSQVAKLTKQGPVCVRQNLSDGRVIDPPPAIRSGTASSLATRRQAITSPAWTFNSAQTFALRFELRRRRESSNWCRSSDQARASPPSDLSTCCPISAPTSPELSELRAARLHEPAFLFIRRNSKRHEKKLPRRRSPQSRSASPLEGRHVAPPRSSPAT